MRSPPHSHLPYPADWLALAAGAFRDGTRVAAADAGLWTAIFRENRGPLLKALDSLQARLSDFKYALMTDDEQAIRSWWEQARHRRDLFDELWAASSPGAPTIRGVAVTRSFIDRSR